MAKARWSEIIRSNWGKIKYAAVEAYKRAAYCDLSGWHFDIEVDRTGNVSVVGPLSPGSQSGESWNGDSCIVVRVRQWTPELNERECMMVTKYAEGRNSLMDEFKDSGYTSEHEFMSEVYPDVLEEWIDDLVEVSACFYEASRELADAIEFAIQEAEREEEQEAQERHFRA